MTPIKRSRSIAMFIIFLGIIASGCSSRTEDLSHYGLTIASDAKTIDVQLNGQPLPATKSDDGSYVYDIIGDSNDLKITLTDFWYLRLDINQTKVGSDAKLVYADKLVSKIHLGTPVQAKESGNGYYNTMQIVGHLSSAGGFRYKDTNQHTDWPEAKKYR
ncbi:MAG: hypothetical protein H0W78_01260 [Planctomycetes bacterium]|nr:hypothetical protein [Planctomycetota bacterium]